MLLKIFSDGANPATVDSQVRGDVATFTITADDEATKDIYVYGVSKIRISKIEIVYDGAISDTLVDKQTVSGIDKLVDNDFVFWKRSASLKETSGTFLTGWYGNKGYRLKLSKLFICYRKLFF